MKPNDLVKTHFSFLFDENPALGVLTIPLPECGAEGSSGDAGIQ